MSHVFFFGDDITAPFSIKNEDMNPFIRRVLIPKFEELKKKYDLNELNTINLSYDECNKLMTDTIFFSVKCGPTYAIILDINGDVWSFSCEIKEKYLINYHNDNICQEYIPQRIDQLIGKKIIKVSCGESHCLAKDTKGNLYGWGNTLNGRLLSYSNKKIRDPQPITLSSFYETMKMDSKSECRRAIFNEYDISKLLDKNKFKIEDLDCGYENSFVVINKRVYAFGKDNLGVGRTTILHESYLKETGNKPFILYNLFKIRVKGISCGKSHALAWDNNGYLYSWGNSEDGKLGHDGDEITLKNEEVLPKRINILQEYKIIQASCGYRHSCALTHIGEILTWGRSQDNMLNEIQNDFENMRPRKLIPNAKYSEQVFFIKIASGAYHNIAIDKKNNLYSWGNGSLGCLGHSDTAYRKNPTLVEDLKNYKIIDANCGEKFTIVIASNSEDKFNSILNNEFIQNSQSTLQHRLKIYKDFAYHRHILQSKHNNNDNDNITMNMNRDDIIIRLDDNNLDNNKKKKPEQLLINYYKSHLYSHTENCTDYTDDIIYEDNNFITYTNANNNNNNNDQTKNINNINISKGQANKRHNIHYYIDQLNKPYRMTTTTMGTTILTNDTKPNGYNTPEISLSKQRKKRKFYLKSAKNKSDMYFNRVNNNTNISANGDSDGIANRNVINDNAIDIMNTNNNIDKPNDLNAKDELGNTNIKESILPSSPIKNTNNDDKISKQPSKILDMKITYTGESNEIMNTTNNIGKEQDQQYLTTERPYSTTQKNIFTTENKDNSIGKSKMFTYIFDMPTQEIKSTEEQELNFKEFLIRRNYIPNTNLNQIIENELKRPTTANKTKSTTALTRKLDFGVINNSANKVLNNPMKNILSNSARMTAGKICLTDPISFNNSIITKQDPNIPVLSPKIHTRKKSGMKSSQITKNEKCGFDPEKLVQFQKRLEKAEKRVEIIKRRQKSQIILKNEEIDIKIKNAKKKKSQVVQEKIRLRFDNVYQKSSEFKALRYHIEQKRNELIELQRIWIVYLNLELIIHTICKQKILTYVTRRLNLMYNFQATRIQNIWRKFNIRNKIHRLSTRQKILFIRLIHKFKSHKLLKNKEHTTRYICLAFIHKGLYKKFKAKLQTFRNHIVPIQKFIQWSAKIRRLRFKKVVQLWDNYTKKFKKAIPEPIGGNSELNEILKFYSNVDNTLMNFNKQIEIETSIINPNKTKNALLKIQAYSGVIKSQFEVMLDTLKLRSSVFTLPETVEQNGLRSPKSQIKYEAKLAESSLLKKHVNPTYTTILKDTLLPYTVHIEEMSFPPSFQLKKEYISTHIKILPKAIEAECVIKAKIIKEIKRELMINYVKELKKYYYNLSEFVEKNKALIDLERAELMLKTPLENLMAITKKEEMEYQMKRVIIQQSRVKMPYNRDPLPFAKLRHKIAMSLAGAPNLPEFKIDLSYETFKYYFKKYFEEYNNVYHRLIAETKYRSSFVKNYQKKKYFFVEQANTMY